MWERDTIRYRYCVCVRERDSMCGWEKNIVCVRERECVHVSSPSLMCLPLSYVSPPLLCVSPSPMCLPLSYVSPPLWCALTAQIRCRMDSVRERDVVCGSDRAIQCVCERERMCVCVSLSLSFVDLLHTFDEGWMLCERKCSFFLVLFPLCAYCSPTRCFVGTLPQWVSLSAKSFCFFFFLVVSAY